jgi:hypothetical protein
MTRRVAISGVAFAFMIGYGKLAVAQSPLCVTSPGDRSVIPPQVSVGGMLAEVLYFGAAPGYPGYNQGELPFAGRCAWWTCCPPKTYLSRSSSNEVAIAVQ